MLYTVNGDTITGIADAIRNAAGYSEEMTLDEMAARIGSIRKNVDGGDILLDANSDNLTINHGLGEMPDLIVISSSVNDSDTSVLKHIIYTRLQGLQDPNTSVQSTSAHYSNANTYSTTVITDITATSFRYASPSHHRYIKAGRLYHWVAMKWF